MSKDTFIDKHSLLRLVVYLGWIEFITGITMLLVGVLAVNDGLVVIGTVMWVFPLLAAFIANYYNLNINPWS